jgi:hypothetical protein
MIDSYPLGMLPLTGQKERDIYTDHSPPNTITLQRLEQVTAVTTLQMQLVSRAAGRSLVNLLLLGILKTGIDLGGA